jgi:hypothetical protein
MGPLAQRTVRTTVVRWRTHCTSQRCDRGRRRGMCGARPRLDGLFQPNLMPTLEARLARLRELAAAGFVEEATDPDRFFASAGPENPMEEASENPEAQVSAPKKRTCTSWRRGSLLPSNAFGSRSSRPMIASSRSASRRPSRFLWTMQERIQYRRRTATCAATSGANAIGDGDAAVQHALDECVAAERRARSALSHSAV